MQNSQNDLRDRRGVVRRLSLRNWLLASRPKTWIASISPVCIGGVLAKDHFDLFAFILCFFFALSLQIGCNFANDYFDFLKGADTPARIGPLRVTAEGLISLSQMRSSLFWIFACASITGTSLAIFYVGPASLLIVLAALLSAWFYTAGKRPLGYLGLGEVLVLLFFGPVALLGTHYVQTHAFSSSVLFASLPPGLLSSAILTANNLRDEATDRAAGKKTLIVRFGQTFGKVEYASFILLAAILPIFLGIYAPLLLLPMAIFPIYKAFSAKSPKEFLPLLPASVLLLIAYTFFFCFSC